MRRAKAKNPAETPARARILEAATRLFTSKPFNEISAHEIAKEAGVAHGLTFHYFGSKDTLYEEVSQAAADRLDRLHISMTLEGSPSQRLRAFLSAHMDAVAARRVDYVFHSRGGGTPAIQAIWEGSRHNAITLVLGFHGVTDPSPELEVAARAWLGYFDELVLAWLQGKVADAGAIVEMAFRQFPLAMRNATILGAKDIPEIPD